MNYTLPNCTEISPMAQVALLQTEMNSGLRFWPRIGKKSPARHWVEHTQVLTDGNLLFHVRQAMSYLCSKMSVVFTYQCKVWHAGSRL